MLLPLIIGGLQTQISPSSKIEPNLTLPKDQISSGATSKIL